MWLTKLYFYWVSEVRLIYMLFQQCTAMYFLLKANVNTQQMTWKNSKPYWGRGQKTCNKWIECTDLGHCRQATITAISLSLYLQGSAKIFGILDAVQVLNKYKDTTPKICWEPPSPSIMLYLGGHLTYPPWSYCPLHTGRELPMRRLHFIFLTPTQTNIKYFYVNF